jgi:hypothetical protein
MSVRVSEEPGVIAQTFRFRLPKEPTRVQSQVTSCGIRGGHFARFVRVLWFPLSILMPRNASYSLIILSETL